LLNRAAEWFIEQRLVAPPDDKPPFDGCRKKLLVLHRNASGDWRLREETWNQALAPDTIAH
jgi:hypothetical protein